MYILQVQNGCGCCQQKEEIQAVKGVAKV